MSALSIQPPPAPSVKTAVIGASGYVGRHLCRVYRSAYPDCVGTSFSAARNDLTPLDIREPHLAALRLEESGHRAVLIASAKPNIGYCQEHQPEAYAVNVRGMLELIGQVARTSMQVIFLSSDYVFDGHTGRYDDDAPTHPSTEYGRQKAAVEQELPSLTDNYLILRLSKIYGVEKNDGTLLDELARALAEGRRVRTARDQRFCPTLVDDLVAAILAIQARGLRGIVNVCSPETWSRHDVALALVRAMQADAGLVESIALYDIAAMAGRPLDTSMRCSRLARETSCVFTPLQAGIDRIAAHWKGGAPAAR